ncbi:MAG TPA: hypothetical protein VLE23_18315 [Geminicoccaceae bacterium]|nr:hypothetical protein [Geminicoccaceae bacterium]
MAQVDRSRRPKLLCALLCLLPAAPAGAQDVAAGLTEALIVGTERVVDQLGRPGGFSTTRRRASRCRGRSTRRRALCAWPACREWSTIWRSA